LSQPLSPASRPTGQLLVLLFLAAAKPSRCSGFGPAQPCAVSTSWRFSLLIPGQGQRYIRRTRRFCPFRKSTDSDGRNSRGGSLTNQNFAIQRLDKERPVVSLFSCGFGKSGDRYVPTKTVPPDFVLANFSVLREARTYPAPKPPTAMIGCGAEASPRWVGEFEVRGFACRESGQRPAGALRASCLVPARSRWLLSHVPLFFAQIRWRCPSHARSGPGPAQVAQLRMAFLVF
jgi:hypothetical protein